MLFLRTLWTGTCKCPGLDPVEFLGLWTGWWAGVTICGTGDVKEVLGVPLLSVWPMLFSNHFCNKLQTYFHKLFSFVYFFNFWVFSFSSTNQNQFASGRTFAHNIKKIALFLFFSHSNQVSLVTWLPQLRLFRKSEKWNNKTRNTITRKYSTSFCVWVPIEYWKVMKRQNYDR